MSQIIYNHQLNSAQKQSVLVVKEAEANFENTKQNIFLKITSAYFDVLNAQDDLKTVTAEKKHRILSDILAIKLDSKSF